MGQEVHILSRIYWVFRKNDIKSNMSPPRIARCGLRQSDGPYLYALKQHNEWTEEPTCETCILLHWANPEGTEHVFDYTYFER